MPVEKQIADSTEYVVLLHGLARSSRSFNKLASVLNEHGYRTVNHNYPSTKYDIARLADDALTAALSRCVNAGKIHFVTHSMGGILLRQFLSQQTIENLGRVVMLGPPNKGSQVVDSLRNFPGFKLINGPAGMYMQRQPDFINDDSGTERR